MAKKKELQAESGAPLSAESARETIAGITSWINESRQRRYATLTERATKEPAKPLSELIGDFFVGWFDDIASGVSLWKLSETKELDRFLKIVRDEFVLPKQAELPKYRVEVQFRVSGRINYWHAEAVRL